MTTSPSTGPAPDLSALARPSGGFAMLAVDQREALRAMLAEGPAAPSGGARISDTQVTDAQVTDFKLRATRTLTPEASAVLVDRQFALDRVVAEGAVAHGCALIAAADRFLPGEHEFVADAEIDERLDPAVARAQGAAALKLLVVWRPDEPSRRRVHMVERFVARCRDAGLRSVIEPVSRAPRAGGAWDWDDGVLAAARELGSLGADLYKAEVPRHGAGEEGEVRERCAELTRLVASPWVVLSSGVDPDAFPRAVELACGAGASGFLAGRAVWRSVIGAADPDAALREDALPRLRRLAAIVDATAHGGLV